MPTILEISSSATFIVRHPVLRKGRPVESCHFDGDDLPATQHYGLYENDALEAVISLFENNHPSFEEPNQTQIRGMAVLEHSQGKGFGKLLVQHCEMVLSQGNTSLIWFNARENAVGFYRKMGYEIIGEPFDIKGIGTHYVMWKKLGN